MLYTNLPCHDVQAVCDKFQIDGPTDLFILRGKECGMCISDTVFNTSVIAFLMYRVVVLISLYLLYHVDCQCMVSLNHHVLADLVSYHEVTSSYVFICI